MISLTGDRATGSLHLGHFVGSLETRLELQEICTQFIMVADFQGLTDNFHNPRKVAENVESIMLDYISVGLDPDKNTFFLQSEIKALYEITCYYLNLITLGRLQRNPTIKKEVAEKGYTDSIPMGFLCHPVSQAADITAFQADLVPVGEDQKPLIEQTNEIVDKFNTLYGGDTIKRVEVLYGSTPRLLGIDGEAKAGKSLGNAIFLTDDTETVKQKIYSMYTDPGHIRVRDPGKVEGNMVFHYLDTFYKDREHLSQLEADYRKGGLGDQELKGLLFKVLEDFLTPIREKRASLNLNQVKDFLYDGSRRANLIANRTLDSIKNKIGMYNMYNSPLSEK